MLRLACPFVTSLDKTVFVRRFQATLFTGSSSDREPFKGRAAADKTPGHNMYSWRSTTPQRPETRGHRLPRCWLQECPYRVGCFVTARAETHCTPETPMYQAEPQNNYLFFSVWGFESFEQHGPQYILPTLVPTPAMVILLDVNRLDWTEMKTSWMIQ